MTFEEKKSWHVVLAGSAPRSLKRIPPQEQVRIREAIDGMSGDPFRGDIRRLKGNRQGFRRRVGAWRIFFDVYLDEKRIVVTAIERRTSTTY